MARIAYLDATSAPEKSKPHLNALQQKLGSTPNLFKALANSPAALGSYTALTGALGDSSLTAGIKESIALTTAQFNSCEYCLAAHTLIGSKAGLSLEDILAARNGTAKDAKAKAALVLTKQILQTKGQIGDTDLKTARDAGLTDGELAEICAVIALNIFTNYFNNLAQNDVDFPKVSVELKAA